MRSSCILAVALCLLPVISFAADKVVVVPMSKGPNIGQQNIIPSTSNQIIKQGYHDGTGVVVGDTDLVAENIVEGVTISV